MPCYQVQLMSVEFQAEHIDLVEEAAKAIRMRVRRSGNVVYMDNLAFDLDTQKISGRVYGGEKVVQEQINKLKRAYSRQVINKTAKANNWTVSYQSTNKAIAQKW